MHGCASTLDCCVFKISLLERMFVRPLAPLPHLFTRLIPKRKVTNVIIRSLARISFGMLRVQVSSENQFVYVVVNFLSQVILFFFCLNFVISIPKRKEKRKLPEIKKLTTTYMLNKQIRKSRKGCYTDTRTCFSRNTIKCCCRRIMLFSRYTRVASIKCPFPRYVSLL